MPVSQGATPLTIPRRHRNFSAQFDREFDPKRDRPFFRYQRRASIPWRRANLPSSSTSLGAGMIDYNGGPGSFSGNGGGDDDRGFVVQVDAFSGPLDLLLHLLREQEIDIADIPIAKVAEQFLGAITSLGLDQAADYLEMAALLLRIKIQMLLPRPFDDEAWEDPRAQLVRRLLEYEQIREVSRWFQDRAFQQGNRFGRGWTQDPPDPGPVPLIVDIDDIVRTAFELVEAMPEPVLHRVVPRPLDVEGATLRLLAMLEARGSFDFRGALGENPTVVDILSILLALLELARLGRLLLRQSTPFADIGVQSESAPTAA